MREISGKTVGVDTMNFIYAFEENPQYIPIVKPLFQRIERGDMKAVTSTVTVVECLVKPFETEDIQLLAKYRMVFRNFPNLLIFPPTLEVAEKAAQLRALHKIKTHDAIQLSTCLMHNASVFITNDVPLSRVADMAVIQLDDFIQ